MILKKIIKRTDSLLEKVPALYESAFPDDERIETEKFMMMIENCRSMTFYAITEDNEFCGMAVIWELGICRYLLYLAVLEEKRNQNLGSMTLEQLLKESDLPIIGEVERPVNNINKRRIEFYKRNGFHIETENPVILNEAHTHSTCVLQLIASSPLQNADECQKEWLILYIKVWRRYSFRNLEGFTLPGFFSYCCNCLPPFCSTGKLYIEVCSILERR